MYLAAHPTSPLPSATSSLAKKKLAKLSTPTHTSSYHKVLLISKTAKPSLAVKVKVVLTVLKAKAPAPSLPVPVIASGPSAPPMNSVMICSGVVGMMAAVLKEDIADTVTHLDYNQLHLGAAIIELKDTISARNTNTAIRDNALITQMADVCKYMSKVHATQPGPICLIIN